MKRSVILGVCVAAFCVVPRAGAGPLAPTKASELRTILGRNTVGCPGIPTYRGFEQDSLNGTPSAFSIPAKSVFVVTS